MGKWRNRFTRTPDDSHMSPEDATGCANDMGSLSVDASTTLLSDNIRGAIIDADDRLKSKGIYWDVTRPIQENGKEEPLEETGMLTRSNNNASTVICNKNGKVPMHNGSVKVNGDGILNKVRCSSATEEEDDDGKDTDVSKAEEMECGLGPCAPKWMQIFASKQAFLVTFCITWVLQGMYYTYFVSVITTLEKLFQIQSKTTGIIMSATEIGQIGSSLLLTYYGGQGHRPKWIAWGMVLFAVSSFTCSLPHFLFGKQLIRDNDVLFGGVASVVGSPYGGNITEPIQPNICNSSHPAVIHNMTTSSTPAMRDASRITPVVLAIFFTSLLGVGMGQTAVYTLGIPYIDDNVASRESPLYFAITIGVRILGPALGFILGSLCTRLYADLTVDPKITPTDPRWVGAWWLGLVMVSALLFLASLAMFSFPKRLSTCRPTPRSLRREKKNPSLRDFPKAVKRLLKNDILMFRTASSVLHILPIAGLYTFLPKYLESQFRLAAHAANMISGVGGILVMGLGIIISGVFILRVKPNARFVAAWIAFTAVVYAIGMGILMLIGCPMKDFAGLHTTSSGLTTFELDCNATCNCDRNKFSPICGRDKSTYFSACHAGCQNITLVDGKIVSYSECLCMQNNSANISQIGKEPLANATIGYCDLECDNFIWYIILFSIFVFIHSTSEVGSMLLILRCVDPRDKAMALGLIQFAIGLFGNVPCPIVYGAVVDSACLVWEMASGERGACRLYDADVFRKFYHGTTGAILLCAFFMDIIVWYKAGSINFVDEQVPPQEEELNPITGKARSETSV
ncbi:solute carrier organic anion transporter family member 74D [Cryptotermes secundus]|nr:solute carrier organic anion transporter family member 74D [Cryptotermes secundus]XP_023718723.1 solute carrier organic anion transporter family member 74D [Cryptotermes secundus]XP_023718724.1 solute carrier organic anion transporter family member 74D [Cryptotermes secundus]XP_033609786.1 solute carrier organic anion transporter family member 74D [Cryptotermes secundus]